MPIFQAPSTPSRAQRIFDRAAPVAVLLACIALGFWQAHTCAQITDASAGSSQYLITFLTAIAIAIGGFLLCIYWRTRLLGASLILAGILTSLVFFADFAWLTNEHKVAWRESTSTQIFAVSMKPDLVIRFRAGTSAEQIRDFTANVLEVAGQPMHPEPEFPWFISGHMVLEPDKDGEPGAAIVFRPSVPADVTSAYVEKIRADTRVAHVETSTGTR